MRDSRNKAQLIKLSRAPRCSVTRQCVVITRERARARASERRSEREREREKFIDNQQVAEGPLARAISLPPSLPLSSLYRT